MGLRRLPGAPTSKFANKENGMLKTSANAVRSPFCRVILFYGAQARYPHGNNTTWLARFPSVDGYAENMSGLSLHPRAAGAADLALVSMPWYETYTTTTFQVSDAVYLLCGPCTFQFGECIIVFHVLNLTYVKGCFHNAADFLDMEADVRRSKLLLCAKVMGIAFYDGIATHSVSIVFDLSPFGGGSSSSSSSSGVEWSQQEEEE